MILTALVSACCVKVTLLLFACRLSSGAQVQDAATLLPAAVDMYGPTALPLLSPALRAAWLLGFCHGQYGQYGARRDYDDDEGRGRRLGRRGDAAP